MHSTARFIIVRGSQLEVIQDGLRKLEVGICESILKVDRNGVCIILLSASASGLLPNNTLTYLGKTKHNDALVHPLLVLQGLLITSTLLLGPLMNFSNMVNKDRP